MIKSRSHHVPRLTFPISRLVRFIIVIGLVVIAGTLFFLFPRDDGTLAEIRQRGTLRVGLDASFPPFETIDEQGQIIGLDVDIARAVAADLGVELELVNIGFDGLYDALLARRADLVISGLPYDPRWTQDVAYTRNYFNAGQVLVAPADETMIDGPDDIAGRTVAVEWGSQADMEGRRLEKEIADVTLQRYPSAAEALDAVLNRQVDVAIVDGVSAVAAASRGLRPVTYLTDEWYAAAVHIDSRELWDAVNQTLTRLDESGEMAKMQAKWLENEEWRMKKE
ncbi:MAG: amino acid ABC transporter substrate-binding protein [Anaerolineaceae bacterium]|nr:amino acid ABC transporter substrate-binding protein [Anaerolineaceae bacterium]MCB9098134.1 amino acid ABC transporter substrate-binding protein [Anaerolineales bacterium]